MISCVITRDANMGQANKTYASQMTLKTNIPFECDISAMKNSKLDGALYQC